MQILDGDVEAIHVPTRDKLKYINWKTADGEIIPINHVDDRHLRNIALFLIGMGYQRCIAPDWKRVVWLTIIRMEWERRKRSKTWIVDMDKNCQDLIPMNKIVRSKNG